MVYRPPFIKQLDGSAYGGLNCTCASMAMLLMREKKGVNPPGTAVWPPTPRALRTYTGDHIGGTNLAQMDTVGKKYYFNLDVRYRLPWASFKQMIKEGRGAILQGRYSAFHRTRYDASGTFQGNHAVYINEIGPDGRFLMYDPLADGRRSGIYKGPAWIDEATLKKFAGRLVLDERRDIVLGYGLAYAGFTNRQVVVTPPVTPVYRYGGVAYGPRALTVSVDKANVRAKPSADRLTPIVYTLNKGQKFAAYQKAKGQLVYGSDVWYGSRRGLEWVHSSVVTGE